MRFKKIMLAFVLIIGSVLTAGFPVFAQENTTSSDKQEGNVISGYSEVNDPGTTLSPVLTFDEVVKEMAKDNNISISEAENHIVSSLAKDSARSAVSPYANTYRTMTSTFTVTSSYKPSVKYYCQTDEGGGSFRAIIKILNVGMDRGYKGISKQFGGSVYTKLENPNKIFYIVNGDFYNNGTTTVNGGVSIGIGKAASVSFGASSTSNHYKYVYTDGYYNF